MYKSKLCYIDTTFSFLTGINLSVNINFINAPIVNIMLSVNNNYVFVGGDDYTYRYELDDSNNY